MAESLIPKHGGYGKRKRFQVSEAVYDLTVRFGEKYILIASAARATRWCRRRAVAAFENEGGFTEQLYRTRTQARRGMAR